jgi:high affinity Mn2+ porin
MRDICRFLTMSGRFATIVSIVGAAIFPLGSECASAADGPVTPAKATAAPRFFDWNGLYAGGHVGYARGNARTTLSDPSPVGANNSFGSLFGGLQIGYNYLAPSRVLLGIEADISFPNYLAADDVVASRTTATTDVAHQIDYFGTLRGRVGYAFDRWLVYGTGGFAWSQARFLQTPGAANDQDKVLRLVTGWTVGAGVQVAIAPRWTTRVEYLYSNFGHGAAVFPLSTRYESEFDIHTLRLALNRKLDSTQDDTAWPKAPDSPGVRFNNWELHGQTTYIQQGYPAFQSPYVGVNSFTPWAQMRNTWTSTAFLGVRLWQAAEFYYSAELLQGFGLHDTTGAGGFPNGEAQKSSFAYPHYHTARLYLRQTFGFGGGEEKLESGPTQLSGKADTSRLTVQVGKFPVTDIFDGNSYARDPRKDFMNWSIWGAGAFDYGADRVGVTYGAVADFNQNNWALRTGYFLMPGQSNADEFDMHLIRRGSYVVELETRYTLFAHPGKLRTIGWVNKVFSGSYSETLANPALNLDITQTRTSRTKYGYAFNVEQSITEDIGVFSRWSWNDGRNEIMAFTDIDVSLSGGVSIKGKAWGRSEDTVGIGAAINGLSKDHRDYLAAGGLGILIGDGRLNYHQERIIESYYSLALNKALALTFDYQLITNPGYNTDRGPISIFSGRLHAEF